MGRRSYGGRGRPFCRPPPAGPGLRGDGAGRALQKSLGQLLHARQPPQSRSRRLLPAPCGFSGRPAAGGEGPCPGELCRGRHGRGLRQLRLRGIAGPAALAGGPVPGPARIRRGKGRHGDGGQGHPLVCRERPSGNGRGIRGPGGRDPRFCGKPYPSQGEEHAETGNAPGGKHRLRRDQSPCRRAGTQGGLSDRHRPQGARQPCGGQGPGRRPPDTRPERWPRGLHGRPGRRRNFRLCRRRQQDHQHEPGRFHGRVPGAPAQTGGFQGSRARRRRSPGYLVQ